MKEHGDFARNVWGFSAATLASRILGYARDAAIAGTFGGGALTDSFYAAFRIANFFRRTLGEGALTSSFVPVLARLDRENPAEAGRFVSSYGPPCSCVGRGGAHRHRGGRPAGLCAHARLRPRPGFSLNAR